MELAFSDAEPWLGGALRPVATTTTPPPSRRRRTEGTAGRVVQQPGMGATRLQHVRHCARRRGCAVLRPWTGSPEHGLDEGRPARDVPAAPSRAPTTAFSTARSPSSTSLRRRDPRLEPGREERRHAPRTAARRGRPRRSSRSTRSRSSGRSPRLRRTTVWVVGLNGTMYKSADGGATWGAVDPATSQTLVDVAFGDASVGWAVGGTSLQRTTNGGSPGSPCRPTCATRGTASPPRRSSLACFTGRDSTAAPRLHRAHGERRRELRRRADRRRRRRPQGHVVPRRTGRLGLRQQGQPCTTRPTAARTGRRSASAA